jgi:hypothetical protein
MARFYAAPEAMWPFTDRAAPLRGLVCYRGPIPPPIEHVLALAAGAIDASRHGPTDPPSQWAVGLTHPQWGEAVVSMPGGDVVLALERDIFGGSALTERERDLATATERLLEVTVTTPERRVLRGRKHLLRWLHLLMSLGGLFALDSDSGVLWSPAMLEDELAHDADLDIASLFTLHAVPCAEQPDDVCWLHTHGLDGLGAFDFDILRPSRAVWTMGARATRALAFAAIEGETTPSTARFALGLPDGDVAFVPAEIFQRTAAAEDAALRTPDAQHGGRRAVVCDPRGRLASMWRTPRPSRFLSTAGDGALYTFSQASGIVVADRARATLPVFRRLIDEFAGTGLSPLASVLQPVVDAGGATQAWIEVTAFDGNAMHGVPWLGKRVAGGPTAGDQREIPLDQILDWAIGSPVGLIAPHDMSPARRLRESGWPAGPFAMPRRE